MLFGLITLLQRRRRLLTVPAAALAAAVLSWTAIVYLTAVDLRTQPAEHSVAAVGHAVGEPDASDSVPF